MNYFEKHIGDWIKDTVKLSMLEDGAYNRMVDQYYQTEQPLPADKKEVYRLARATSAAERKAVDYILKTYFTLTDAGYAQKRCDENIERYWDRDQADEAKKENDRERQQRARERRKSLFVSLRDHGIVPEFNTPTKQLAAMLSRVTKPIVTPPVTPTVTRDNTAIQTPDANPQTPDLKPSPSGHVVGTASREGSEDKTPANEAEWLRHMRDTHGVEGDAHSIHDRKRYWPVFARWAKAGLTTHQVDVAVEKAYREATNPIANIVAYVDTVLSSQGPPRASPQRNTIHDQRAHTIAVLTGQDGAQHDADEFTFDTHGRRIG